MLKTLSSAPLALSLLISANIHAQDKHVHGEAELFIAMEKNTLLIEMESPAANIIGFEHAPKTKEQHAVVDKAIHQLEDMTSIVNLSQGSCKVINAKVNSPFGDEEHEEHDDHHGHDKHNEHKDHHGHAKHDEHKGHHDHAKHDEHKDHHGHAKHDEHKDHSGHDHHDHHGSEEHSDFHLNYELHCDNIAQIKQVDITAFKHFPALEEVHVHWVTEQTQGATPATPKNHVISLY